MVDAARVLDALGDPTRRAILDELADGELPVHEIAARLPVSRPAVSRHLRVLGEAGLVDVRAEGTRRLYRLDLTGREAVEQYLRETWSTASARFALVAGNTTETPAVAHDPADADADAVADADMPRGSRAADEATTPGGGAER